MSGLPFELLLALRYLRPKRTFVSVITLISVAGVALGVAVLIIVISVMSGFDKQLRDTILGFNAHLEISIPDQTMSNYREVMSIVSSNKHVRGVAPFVWTKVLMETTTNEHSGQIWDEVPILRGVDPDDEKTVSTLPSSIEYGSFDLSGHGILLGSILARELRVQVGDTVNITTANDAMRMHKAFESGEKLAIPPMEYEVRGIFDIGFNDFDANMVVVSLANAQDMLNLGDKIHGLTIKLNDPFTAMEVRSDLSHALGPQYKIDSWMQNKLLGAVAVEKNVMFIILFCVMIVASLCILSALVTFVVQKTREIGMLKALGATDFQVGGLFLSQSAFIGTIGVFTGLMIGLLAVHYRNEFLFLMRRVTGMELFPADIYQFNKLPAQIVPTDILLICGSALIICILGGVLPAWRAWRLKPVEALRYE
jgi:lipoprotein-releasing system permease protein